MPAGASTLLTKHWLFTTNYQLLSCFRHRVLNIEHVIFLLLLPLLLLPLLPLMLLLLIQLLLQQMLYYCFCGQGRHFVVIPRCAGAQQHMSRAADSPTRFWERRIEVRRVSIP